MSECEIQKEFDEYAWFDTWYVRCKTHSDNWVKWRPGDPTFVCLQGGGRDTNTYDTQN